MNYFKLIRDKLVRVLLDMASFQAIVPKELADLHEYFRSYGALKFDLHQSEDGWVAVSNNFRYGSIIANGRTPQELEKNIPDAIMTAFDLPSSYSKEAKLHKVMDQKEGYAFA